MQGPATHPLLDALREVHARSPTAEYFSRQVSRYGGGNETATARNSLWVTGVPHLALFRNARRRATHFQSHKKRKKYENEFNQTAAIIIQSPHCRALQAPCTRPALVTKTTRGTATSHDWQFSKHIAGAIAVWPTGRHMSWQLHCQLALMFARHGTFTTIDTRTVPALVPLQYHIQRCRPSTVPVAVAPRRSLLLSLRAVTPPCGRFATAMWLLRHLIQTASVLSDGCRWPPSRCSCSGRSSVRCALRFPSRRRHDDRQCLPSAAPA
jgi:hypothetical protein